MTTFTTSTSTSPAPATRAISRGGSRRLAAALVAVAATTLALTGCAIESNTASESTATAAESVTLSDGWIKAADTDDMTAAFGILENTGDVEVTLVSVETDAAGMTELHETVDDGSGSMAMQEKDGGFTIAAGDSLALEPGGNHIMLMGLAESIVAGDEVTMTLEFADGSTLDVTVPGKDYSGANENYTGGDMDMGDE